MAKPPTAIRLSEELNDKLTDIAKSKGTSRNALIRMVLQAYVDGDQTTALATGSQGVRDALEAVMGRIQALEENSSVLLKSTQQNFGLLEEKADLGEFRRLEATVQALQTMLQVRDAADTKPKHDLKAFEAAMSKAQPSPKPEPKAKDWAAQFNS